jgi:protein involved in polysaccharide export with SLBB domain
MIRQPGSPGRHPGRDHEQNGAGNRVRISTKIARALALALFFAGMPALASGQLPVSPDIQRMLMENPDLIRQQIMQSGMSEAEIRAQLAAAGLPAAALDAFLAGDSINIATAFTPDAVQGLQMLGVAVETADGLEFVEPLTGMQTDMFRDSLEEGGIPVFGHGVFSRATSQFQPLLSGPVGDDYRIGPGDQLLLLITGEVEQAHDLVVTGEGFVAVPNVGRISVANLTMADARSVVRRRLAASYSGIDRGTTTVNLSVTEVRTIQVYVIGEVEQPGAYQLASVATVTNAMYAAGGPTDMGNLRGITIQRREGEDVSFDLYPYLLAGDVSGDITLQQGDVVFVPVKDRRVLLQGSVVRPAYYDVNDNEDLADVLAAARFGAHANRRRLTIHRIVRPADRGPGLGDRVAIDLPLTPAETDSATNAVGGVVIPPVGLQDGDSIVVDSVPSLSQGYYITISGMVAQPDTFPWREGMTLREAVELARGPLVGADLREAEVSRMPDERAMGELADRLRVPLDSSYLSQRDANGRYVGPPGVEFPPSGSAPEFELDPYDHVMILRQPEFEMQSSVQITGEVSVPGNYTLLSKEDRVVDLVGRAGRILDTGYLEGARLYRSVDRMGRIDLDLPAAIADPEGPENLVLQPGDSLHIPFFSPTVVVQGAVNSPVTVLYRDDQDFDYYISAAGGFRSDADKGRTAVRFANGLARTRSKFLFWSSYPDPGPGSTIVVPAKDPADRIDTTRLITDLVTIVGSITTIIVVIVSNSN